MNTDLQRQSYEHVKEEKKNERNPPYDGVRNEWLESKGAEETALLKGPYSQT